MHSSRAPEGVALSDGGLVGLLATVRGLGRSPPPRVRAVRRNVAPCQLDMRPVDRRVVDVSRYVHLDFYGDRRRLEAAEYST